jgi:hypothetical protein
MSPVPESADRRHLILTLTLAVVVIGSVGWFLRPDGNRRESPDGVAAVPANATASEPGCGPVLREPVGDAGDHIDAPISYSSAPPSFGDHNSRWEVRARPFYDVDDRPDVSVLVHNLEHGYNILWYDQAVLDDVRALTRVQVIAAAYATSGRERDPATAFIAAPWTASDGEAFPDGMHYALTHWYADPLTRSRADEVGLTRYCSGISAEVVQDWMQSYPLRDAPEGYPDLM